MVLGQHLNPVISYRTSVMKHKLKIWIMLAVFICSL